MENMARLEEALLQKANVTKQKRQTVKQTQVRPRTVIGPLNSWTESAFGLLHQRTRVRIARMLDQDPVLRFLETHHGLAGKE